MAELISGATSFATEGERRAAEILQQLPASWLVICNKTLPYSHGRSAEMDFIVVGKRWVFLLDEKSWRGKIAGNEEQWVRADNSSERSPLAKVDYLTKVLAGRIGWSVPPLKNGPHFVRGGVLLSTATELPIIYDQRAKEGLFLLEDVCQRLEYLDSKDGNEDVGRLREHIKKSLVDLSNRLAVPQRINDVLTIEEATTIRPGVRLFWATMDSGDTRQLMVYDLTVDPISPDQLRDFYQREFRVLNELSATGLVAQVETPFVWSDNFFIVPIVPLKGQPLSVHQAAETADELAQELLLAAACFKGLHTIHSRSIIHRAIGPDTVYVLQGGYSPKVAFTNFFAARMGAQSIAPQLAKQGLVAEDPYAALDLAIGYEFATQATDVFSLALVFLERIAGVPISTIRSNVESDIAFPTLQQRWSFIPMDIADELTTLFQHIITPPQPQTLLATEIAEHLSELAQRLRSEQTEERYFLNKRYKMQRVLGQGAMARTYLAGYTDYASADLGLCVLKQFLRPEDVYEQAIAEYGALRNLKSKYFPTIMDIFLRDDDVHIKMEYIPGPTLQEVQQDFPFPLDRWWAFAHELLNALEELERKGLFHRDIKPANIILHEDDDHPVLIDFGFAVKQRDQTGVAPRGTPLYLPPETLADPKQVPPTIDRYAAAVVLFQVLTGSLPFKLEPGQRLSPRVPAEITDARVRRVANALVRAISPDPAERPETTAQLRQMLQNALQTVEEPAATPHLSRQINPWVEQIRGLYRNSATGNADNRGLDSAFVRSTYVETALDQELLPAIFTRRPKAVFLTGNPGDGKTAFLEQVKQELSRKHAQQQERSDASGWEWDDAGHIFRSCYDASEAHKGQSADAQLLRKLQGLQGDHAPDASLTVLVAINDGRLVDFFARHWEQFPWLTAQVEQAQEALSQASSPVWVVDLKRRAFVHLPDTEQPSIFAGVLHSLVAAEHWTVCNTCVAQTMCPLLHNATALRKKRVQQKLEYLLLLTHLRRQRHMTMRDLRSALAYLISGNADCTYIHSTHNDEEAGASLENLKYWHSSFAPSESSDELLQDLTALDPARFPQPHLDRYLHFHQAMADAEARRALFADNSDLPLQRFPGEIAWMAAMKRRLYFEAKTLKAQEASSHGAPRVRSLALLPYKYAKDFMNLLANSFDEDGLDAMRKYIALGILHSEGILEDISPEHLTIRVHASEEQQLLVLKQFPLADFTLRAEQLSQQDSAIIERLPEVVIFEHKRGYPRLEITLDLFELLMRTANGLLPTAEEFQPLLEDLTLFKNALILEETRDLVLIENGYRMHRITQEAGKIVRTTL
ncbi:MAG: NERD domain-containing protein [Ktedonobacteraceae bacterium]